MTLYEATNEMIGESYFRCYIWAPDEDTAMEMALDKFNENAKRMSRQGDVTLKELMYDHSQAFVTKVSDSGWEG